MQSFANGLSRSRIRRQSGAVAMLGALWLMVAVICLATIDIGNVFWQKRELQKIADLAALAGASGALSTFCDSGNGAARTNATSNGLLKGEYFSAVVGKWSSSSVSSNSSGFIDTNRNSNEANACKVIAKREVPFLFVFSSAGSSARIIEVSAIARQSPRLAKITVRSTLLNVDTDNSILRPLLKGLLGTSVNIDAVGWKGLAEVDLDLLSYLKSLSTKLNLKIGNYSQLLDANVTVGFLLETMIEVLQQGGAATAKVNVLRNLLVAVNVRPVTVKLSELLNVGAGLNDSALKTSINVLDVASALVMLANGKNSASANLGVDLGLVRAKVDLKVTEPPQWAIGNPEFDNIEAKTSQIKLNLSTGLELLLLALDVDLGINVGNGSAKIVGYSCEKDNKNLKIKAETGLLDLELRLGVRLLIIPINIKVPIKLSDYKIEDYKNTPRLTEPSLWKSINLNFNIISSLINGAIKALLAVFNGDPPPSGFVEMIIDPLSRIIDLIVGSLLDMLGVKISKVDVGAQLNCDYQPDLVF